MPPTPADGADEDGDGGDGDRRADRRGGEDGAPDDDPPARRPCPACGRGMVRRHCEYVCPRHGVVYDCSDTFW